MLDADFEYGLQPTKWQAIAMQRGYPSIYEVPGTDKVVASVKTDASTGTGGVGQSLITVTTVGGHGITAGTPITIKALENSIQGASRAEGSFIVSTVPTASTFTYFAKSKVGTANNQVLSTYYTQLREGGFYTGAAIGVPTFTILSQGTAGVFTNPLGALNGSDKVTWIGNTPEIGAPMQNVSGQIATVNTYNAANASRTPGTYTVTNATYNSADGTVVATIGSHTFEPHDWIRFADANAITMNPPLPTGYHNNVAEITATTTTTISFKIMGGSGTYSFISGSTNGIISNWTGYINDSQEKCKRDTRYNCLLYTSDAADE